MPLAGGQCTEVRFASFLSGVFITAIVVNPLESNLKKRTSVQCGLWPTRNLAFQLRGRS